MSHRTIVVALLVMLFGGAALGYWLADRRTPGSESAAQDESRVLYWYDPMKPEVKFDKPGKSPFMDMPLVPRYAGDESGPAVRVDPAVAQNLGIRIGRVEKAVLESRLAAVGSVAFDELLLNVVQARVEGYVTRLHVKAPLAHVRRGQPLAEVVAPEWRAAQEEYLALLEAESERSRPIRDAARERLVVLGVPEATIRRIEETRKAVPATPVLAPSDGVLTGFEVREGATFMPGAPLFRINGLRTVWVIAQVPEARVAAISPGAGVEARATAWAGDSFKGRVAALLPEVDPQTRTLPVRIVIDNPERKLVPGMFVTVEFEGATGEPQLVVPSEAVIVTGERSVVVVAREGGGFDVAEVTTGAEVDAKTAILSGLAEGQSVVLSGQFLIDSEASLESAITRLDTQRGPPETSP